MERWNQIKMAGLKRSGQIDFLISLSLS